MGFPVKKKENDAVENQCRIFVVPGEIEVCTICGCKTGINSKTPVDKRQYYVDCCGQLCRECWNELYGLAETDDFLV